MLRGGISRRASSTASFLFFVFTPKPWVPRPCVVCKGGYDAACAMLFVMPRLRRCGQLWFPPFAKNAKDGAPAATVRQTLNPKRAAEASGGVVRFCAVVVEKHGVEAAIAE